MPKTDMAVASAAILVEAQWVEAAEAMGSERDHLPWSAQLFMFVLMLISLLLLLQLPQLIHFTLIVKHLFPILTWSKSINASYRVSVAILDIVGNFSYIQLCCRQMQ